MNPTVVYVKGRLRVAQWTIQHVIEKRDLVKPNKLFVLILAFVLALGVVGLSGCSSDAATSESGGGATGEELIGSINVEGSDTIVNMGQAWAEEFMNENPGVMVSVKGG